MMIFVCGEEALLVRDHVKKMRDRFAEKYDPSGMNIAEFSVSDGTFERGAMMQAVQSPPFLGEKRFILVRGLLESLHAKEAKEWAGMLSHVPDSTIMVFVEHLSEKKLQKHHVYRAFEKEKDVHVYHFPRLELGERNAWASAYAKEIGLVVAPPLLQRIVAMVGEDTWQLSLELQKLAAFADGKPLKEEMVEVLIQANFTDQMFAFMDALSQQKREKALSLLYAQRASGSSDFQIFAMLCREIRLLLGARDMIDHHPSVSKQSLAESLGIHPYVAQKTLTHARAFRRETLVQVHRILLRLDRAMKSGRVDAQVAVDRIIAEMLATA